jgi:hypothetical protein
MPRYCNFIHEDGQRCKKAPDYYNISNKKGKRFCKEHKQEGMICVVKSGRFCVDLSHGDEKKRATFNFPGKPPKFCAKHKQEGMMNVIAKKCKCGKHQPAFGIPGEKPTCCASCREEGMLDLISVLCEICGKNATRGMPGQRLPSRCRDHAEDGMYDMKNKKCEECIKQKVRNPPQSTFGFFGKPATRCIDHKEDGMVDVKHPLCKNCRKNNIREGELCFDCKPREERKGKERELAVVDFLRDNGIEFIHDRYCGEKNGNYKPDIKIDCASHLVMVEIDEKQHASYGEQEENWRMIQIAETEKKPCIFIRYNPDKFKLMGKSRDYPQEKRFSLLIEKTRFHMKNAPKVNVAVYRFFYDNPGKLIVAKYDIYRCTDDKNSCSESSKLELPIFRYGIKRFSKTGEFIDEFLDIREASRKTGISHRAITSCIKERGENGTAGGYKWRLVG